MPARIAAGALALFVLRTAWAGPASGTGAAVTYDLARDSVVTVNVTRPDGWVVRELVVGEPRKAGRHTVHWDGRDNMGYLLPPGDYCWRMATHDGLTWDYVTSVGNSGTPPWRTPDGTGGWGGNHGQNTAVAVDETGAYLGWVSTEGPHCIVKRTHDGSKGVWGIHLGPFEGVHCLAADGRFLYGVNTRRLMAIDRGDGRVLASLDIEAGPAGEVKAPLPPEFTAFSWNFATHKAPPQADPLVWGLAAGGGRVYVSLPWRDVVQAFRAVEAGGGVELRRDPDADLAVPRPAGLALDGRGRLMVVSVTGGKVLEVDLATKRSKSVVTGLAAPFALARAPSGDATFYVAEDAPVHQIHRFSAAGKRLASFGRKGGPNGDNTRYSRHVPGAFWRPCALAVNPDGGVWFVDDTFKRIGIVSPEGEVRHETFGSVNYAATCAMNPNDPSEVFTTMWGNATFRIDFEKKGFARPCRWLDVKWGGADLGLDMGWGALRMLSREGRTYLWTGKGLLIVEDDHLRPVMWFFPRVVEEGPVGELAKRRGVKPRGWNTDPTIWCDLNGNAAVEEDEVQFVPLPGASHGPQLYGQGDLAEDFALVTYGYTWRPARFTGAGAPVYRGEDIARSERWNPHAAPQYESVQPVRLSDGGYAGFAGMPEPGSPTGTGFWAGRSSGAQFVGYGPDWKPRWRVGRKARRTARQGEIYFPFRTVGRVDGCVLFTDVEGCVHAVHEQGFYLQRVLQDGWHTSAVGPDVIRVENFSGSVLKHPRTGRPYLTISSSEATHVFELKGIDSIRVSDPKPLAYPAPARAAAPSEYRIRRVPEGTQALPGHMGGALPQTGLSWPSDVEPIVIRRRGEAVGEVRMLHDDAHLYVSAHSFLFTGARPGRLEIRGDRAQGDPLASEETVVVLVARAPRGDDGHALVGNPARDGVTPGPGNSPFRYVFGHVNTKGDVAVYQWGGEPVPGMSGGPDVWKYADRHSLVKPMPADNGMVYELVLPIRWMLGDAKLGKPLPVRLDVGFLVRDPAAGKAQVVYWSGRAKEMQDPADTGFRVEGWGRALLDTGPALAGAENAVRAPRGERRVIDGDPKDWPEARWHPLGGASEVDARASFRAAWDAERLYVMVRVRDETPLRNRSSVPEMIFKGGDAVTITFGKAGGEGAEQRIAFAQVGGRAAAVLYRPASPRKKPCTFESPVSKVTFDYVAPMPEAEVALRAEPGGYAAEIAVPWTSLGYAPEARKSIPFDVQAIFSDATGSANAGCVWWRSTSAEAHANNDVPTEVRLYPAEWGALILD